MEQRPFSGRSVAVMTYNVRTMASRAPLVIDYGAFKQPPSPLFRDYLMGAPTVRAFYGGARWDLDGLAESQRGEHLAEATTLREAIHDTVSSYLYERTKRRPMVLPVIMQV